jgi:hypothetical protein
LVLPRQAGRDAKTRQPDLAGLGLHEDIGRLDILVDEASLVQPPQRAR